MWDFEVSLEEIRYFCRGCNGFVHVNVKIGGLICKDCSKIIVWPGTREYNSRLFSVPENITPADSLKNEEE